MDLPSYNRAALFALALMPVDDAGRYDIEEWRALWYRIRDAFPKYRRTVFFSSRGEIPA